MCTCACRRKASATCPAGTRTWPRPMVDAIREACPGVIINLTTGVIGKDISGPAGLHPPRQARDRRLQRRQPELPEAQGRRQLGLAAHGVRQPGGQGAAVPGRDGECGTHPEFECFDVGIVRSSRCTSRTACSSPRWAARIQPGDGRGLGHALRRRNAGAAAAMDGPRRVWQTTLIGRAGDLAGAPEDRRARRHAAHGPGRHLLPARRQSRASATAC
jgi:3-keto-5-aminohexanoate cleavage enzyme